VSAVHVSVYVYVSGSVSVYLCRYLCICLCVCMCGYACVRACVLVIRWGEAHPMHSVLKDQALRWVLYYYYSLHLPYAWLLQSAVSRRPDVIKQLYKCTQFVLGHKNGCWVINYDLTTCIFSICMIHIFTPLRHMARRRKKQRRWLRVIELPSWQLNCHHIDYPLPSYACVCV